MARAAAVLLLFGLCAVARAEGAATVVVFPFASADEELVIYGKPVADALVKGLSKDGVHAVVAARDAGAPQADMVVELRASRARRKVRVEAIVRDSETGQPVASVSARSRPLSDLDVAAAELARGLVRPLADAETGRRERQSREKTETAAAPPPAPAPGPKLAPPDARPAVLIYRPDGIVAGSLPVTDVGTAALVELLGRLGYRSIISGSLGVAAPAVAAASARAAGARATVMLRVEGVEFTWDGVLLAQGKLRLLAVGPDARVLFDRELTTDTLVGSRGDRHDALLRFVVRQAMDMSRRELALALR